MPTVTTDLRIVTVELDGLDEFGEAMPVDFNHTRIYFAAAEDMAGAEQVGLADAARHHGTPGSMARRRARVGGCVRCRSCGQRVRHDTSSVGDSAQARRR